MRTETAADQAIRDVLTELGGLPKGLALKVTYQSHGYGDFGSERVTLSWRGLKPGRWGDWKSEFQKHWQKRKDGTFNVEAIVDFIPTAAAKAQECREHEQAQQTGRERARAIIQAVQDRLGEDIYKKLVGLVRLRSDETEGAVDVCFDWPPQLPANWSAAAPEVRLTRSCKSEVEVLRAAEDALAHLPGNADLYVAIGDAAQEAETRG